MVGKRRTTLDIETLLPLGAVDLQILLVLTQGDLHGYGLMKAVEEQSAGGQPGPEAEPLLSHQRLRSRRGRGGGAPPGGSRRNGKSPFPDRG